MIHSINKNKPFIQVKNNSVYLKIRKNISELPCIFNQKTSNIEKYFIHKTFLIFEIITQKLKFYKEKQRNCDVI